MSAFNPSVSILLPVHNDSSYLVRIVTSMRRQTFQVWEQLLVDDGSTDDSPEWIGSLARVEPRIGPGHLPHRGITATLNTSIKETTGRYIAGMEADDVSHAHRLALQKTCLEEEPAICARGCMIRVFPRKEASLGMLAYEGWINSVVTPEQIARETFVEAPRVHRSGYREPEDFLCIA